MLNIELELTKSDENMLKKILDRELKRLSDTCLYDDDTIPTISLCHKICNVCRIADDARTAKMN